MDKINIQGVDIYYHDDENDPIISYLKTNKLYGEVQYALVSEYALGNVGYIIDCGAGIGTFSFVPVSRNLPVLILEQNKDNLDCLNNTYSKFENTIIENSYDIDKICSDNIIDYVDMIKFSAGTEQISALTNSSKILERSKPVLLLTVDTKKVDPYITLEKLDELGYLGFLYNATNFLIFIDKNQIFPFCLMDLICIHKSNIHKYIGKITIGSCLPDNVLQNIVKENLSQSQNDTECKKYLELIKHE